jgi:hypothetical protein
MSTKKRQRPLKSKFTLINEWKYSGNPETIVCRSGPERALARYFDENTNVKKWSSESVIIPYLDVGDGKWHRYFVDFLVELVNGTVLLIEFKPYSQTQEPIPPKRKTKKAIESYSNAVSVYLKNRSKWKAAKEYADKKGWKFQVWHEETLAAIGIRAVRQ